MGKHFEQEAGGAGTPRHDMEERPRSEAPRARDPRLSAGGGVGYAQDSGCCYLTMVRTLSIQETAQIRLKRHETGVLCSPLLSTEASGLQNGGQGVTHGSRASAPCPHFLRQRLKGPITQAHGWHIQLLTL